VIGVFTPLVVGVVGVSAMMNEGGRVKMLGDIIESKQYSMAARLQSSPVIRHVLPMSLLGGV
jgi:hypothetical protein